MKRLVGAVAIAMIVGSATAQTVDDDVLRPITNAQIMPYAAESLSITARSAGGAVRLLCTTTCYIIISATPHASAVTGVLLNANTAETFLIRPGERVAVIRATADGKIHVQELGR